jgi:hypothetical protein
MKGGGGHHVNKFAAKILPEYDVFFTGYMGRALRYVMASQRTKK